MTDNINKIRSAGDLRKIKPVEWVKGSREALKEFPDEARNIAGNQIWLVQLGRMPDDWDTIGEIGHGAFEIRIHKPHEHRVICVASFQSPYTCFIVLKRKPGKHHNTI